MTAPPFGAILAGGRSRRYGGPKALATIGGERLVDRVRRALLEATPDLIVIANDAEPYAELGLPIRPDAIADLGALGGIYSALLWAREAGRPGILAVACDMPFLSPPLLRRLLAASPGCDVAAPESGGRRGVEPLCAYYATTCIPAIEAELARGERHIVGFYDDVRVRRISLEAVRRFGDPERLFLNVNTPEERERAERLVDGTRAAGATEAGTRAAGATGTGAKEAAGG